MHAAAQRGDYDAAIVVAQQLNDQASLDDYRKTAATVLVRRAAKAAQRGDLALARTRLRHARTRYETAPGASAVNARIRRIERDRRRRAERQRQRERRQAAASRAATASAPVTAPTAPSPSPTTPQPSDPPASSSPSTPKRSKEPEQAVDPGLF